MRVTENTTANVVKDSLNRSRVRMADYQRQNATQKRINSPSDDAVGNVKLMAIRNENIDNNQFEKNANLAKTFLNFTDSSLEEMSELLMRAKELALNQASSASNGPDSRLMVAEEIKHIGEQMKTIANRRLADRYIFGGFRTNAPPFEQTGEYNGDDGNIMVEVQKDLFVTMNLPGRELFLGKLSAAPLKGGEMDVGRDLATEQAVVSPAEDIFKTLDGLRVGLMTNDVKMIQSTLDPLDNLRNRVIVTRAQLGSRISGIDTALTNMANRTVQNAELSSSIEDADLIEVVSNLAKEETVLRASLMASNKLIQPSLLDFLK